MRAVGGGGLFLDKTEECQEDTLELTLKLGLILERGENGRQEEESRKEGHLRDVLGLLSSPHRNEGGDVPRTKGRCGNRIMPADVRRPRVSHRKSQSEEG